MLKLFYGDKAEYQNINIIFGVGILEQVGNFYRVFHINLRKVTGSYMKICENPCTYRFSP